DDPYELALALHQLDPKAYPEPKRSENIKPLEVHVSSRWFGMLEEIREKQNKPITLTVQEAFMTYLKVAFITGLVMAAPWIFYQIWLFVAAGLYPHERRYVHVYLPMSIILFLGGASFCFFVVFPYVLDFLLGFNSLIGVVPQIRLSEWISF